MKKQCKTLLFSLVLPFSLLFSCGQSSISSSSDKSSIEPELKENEVRVKVEEGKAHLSWNALGYDGFEIYGSESKYGTYRLISGETLLKEKRFITPSYRYGFYKVMGVKGNDKQEIDGPSSVFGNETLIVSPTDNMTSVQEEIEERHSHLETASEGQFSSSRFAALFYPGQYPDIEMKLGYYSSALGLGEVPYSTELGKLFVSTEVLSNNNSTCTFWRNAMNLSFPESTQFAVSQATSLRRCHFARNLYLAHPTGWSSGGFLADSVIEGRIESRTQQQYMNRNDEFTGWVGSSHNYVFSGCIGGVPKSAWSERTSRTSVEEKCDKIAEAPFLYEGKTGLNVFVPSIRENAAGVSYSRTSMGEGKSLPLDDFYVASPLTDDATSLNEALDKGLHLLFAPGIYKLDKPLHISKPDTVVLGIGYPTLEINNGRGGIEIDDVDGVRFSSLLVDAGEGSHFMVRVGANKSEVRHEKNPVVLSDLFCRIGGKENAHTETDYAVIINSNDVIGDNFWLWRADHSRGVAWDDMPNEWGGTSCGNPAATGLLVEGDHVTCYGLMVEHFENYQTLWNGEEGKVVMYQCEVPYNVPSQDYWKSESGTRDGCAAYKVGSNVKTHYGLGLGVYWVHYSYDFLENAFECPDAPGVKLEHLVTTTFSGYENGGIRHIVNGVGDSVGEGGSSRALYEVYPAVSEGEQ